MPHKIESLFSAGYVDSNVYVITDEATGFSAVIDPDFQYIKEAEVAKEFDIKLILLTHAHFDHVYSAEKLREITKAPILIHELDFDALNDEKLNLSRMFGNSLKIKADKCFKDGDIISLGESSIKVLHTPGHTKGSSCFIIGEDMISGDMLFNYSIGRTDFPGGSTVEMRSSINKLKALDTDYKVYPGHGSLTSLFFEKKNNPYF